jgi:hypothetical protein
MAVIVRARARSLAADRGPGAVGRGAGGAVSRGSDPAERRSRSAPRAAQFLALVEQLRGPGGDGDACRGRPAGRRRVRAGPVSPGGLPDLDSPSLAACRRVIVRVFGETPEVAAVRASLETAVIGNRIPGLDIVSFGPRPRLRARPTTGQHPDRRTLLAPARGRRRRALVHLLRQTLRQSFPIANRLGDALGPGIDGYWSGPPAIPATR